MSKKFISWLLIMKWLKKKWKDLKKYDFSNNQKVIIINLKVKKASKKRFIF